MHGVIGVGKRKNYGKRSFIFVDFGGKGTRGLPRLIDIGFGGGRITLIHGSILA